GGDTISFAAGLKGTLALTLGMLPTITGNVAIAGPGANVLTIDGQGTSRIMWIQLGSTVLVSGLTLSGGHATGTNNIFDATGWGGAILKDGTLTLVACALSNNTADFGGAVFNNAAGKLTMFACTVSGNAANSDGGGIFNFGDVALTNCTVAGNSAAL